MPAVALCTTKRYAPGASTGNDQCAGGGRKLPPSADADADTLSRRTSMTTTREGSRLDGWAMSEPIASVCVAVSGRTRWLASAIKLPKAARKSPSIIRSHQVSAGLRLSLDDDVRNRGGSCAIRLLRSVRTLSSEGLWRRSNGEPGQGQCSTPELVFRRFPGVAPKHSGCC